jgi:hypothetical protein
MKVKKSILVSGIVLLITIALFLFVTKALHPTQGNAIPQNVLNVDDIALDPSVYTGKISVAGAVSFVYPSQDNFVIIDIKEYDKCGVVTCAINHLTVSYQKQLPNVKDRVIINGELVKTNSGYILNAESVGVK